MGVNKYSDFRMLQWTKRDKTGQNDPQSATYTQPNKGGVTCPPFRFEWGP